MTTAAALACLGIAAAARGVLLAARRTPQAPAWLALGALTGPILIPWLPRSSGLGTAIAFLAVGTFSLAGLSLALRLRRDQVAQIEAEDHAQLRELLLEARLHRLSRRLRGRPRRRRLRGIGVTSDGRDAA